MYTRFLSTKFGVFLGKIDTIDGDPNEFASGRGTSQFMNANFVYKSTLVAAHLALDAQYVDPVSTDLDEAVILGMRLGLAF